MLDSKVLIPSTAVASTATSQLETILVGDPELHCSHGALTNSFGWFVQGVLAGLAFACLIVKRFCEPRRHRRPWIIWFYDTSKQAVGALVIHFANIFLAEFFQGDPCTWYIVSFLLDSSLGLMFLFAGIRLTQHIARKRGWDALMFGEYGIPPEPRAWLAQCAVYITLMLCEKVMVVLVIQLHFWERVRVFIMSPIRNPKVEVALVVLVIPFFINVFIFWVTDNFLMHKPRKMKRDKETSSPQARVFYRQDDLSASPECEVLLSGDDRSDGTVHHHHRPTVIVK